MYNFRAFLGSKLVCLCCEKKCKCAKGCTKNKKTHDETAQRLKEELDILGFLKRTRISSFICNNYLQEYQKWFVMKFPKYCIFECDENEHSDKRKKSSYLDDDVKMNPIDEEDLRKEIVQKMKKDIIRRNSRNTSVEFAEDFDDDIIHEMADKLNFDSKIDRRIISEFLKDFHHFDKDDTDAPALN